MTTAQPTPTLAPSGRPALLVTRSADLAAIVQALTPPDQPLLVITPDQLPDAGWARCPLILIDADTAPETTALVGASLDVRKPVLLSARQDTTAELWRAAVALRAEHVACLPEATDWVRDRLRAATRDNTLVITVMDVCGDPHGTALAAALATASCTAGRHTLLAATSRHHDAVPDLLDELPATRPAAGHGDLLVLGRDPDASQVSAQEIHGVLAHALTGDTVIIDVTPLDTDAARAPPHWPTPPCSSSARWPPSSTPSAARSFLRYRGKSANCPVRDTLIALSAAEVRSDHSDTVCA